MLFTLAYHTYFESKTEILVFQNIFIDSKERFYRSTFSMVSAKLRCCVQTMDRKGPSFSDLLDQCSLVTAKFDMSDDMVRSILKAKMYQFFVMKCVNEFNSCNNFVI